MKPGFVCWQHPETMALICDRHPGAVAPFVDDGSMGEVYTHTVDVEPGEQLVCDQCGRVVYTAPGR